MNEGRTRQGQREIKGKKKSTTVGKNEERRGETRRRGSNRVEEGEKSG